MIPFITSYLQSVTQDVKGTYVSFVFRVIEACMKHPFIFSIAHGFDDNINDDDEKI